MSAQPPHRRSRARRAVAAAAAAATLGAPLLAAAPASAAPSPRVLLRVLVVSDGSPWAEALANQLDRTGVPYTRVAPGDAGRPTVDASFLVRDGAAQYQAVVLPNTGGGGLSAAELTALAAYEATYGVREVDGYNWPGAAGLVTSFAGSLDGAAATVTPEANAAGFGYLRGALTIDDVDPNVSEVFGYLASPPATPGPDESYTPFLPGHAGHEHRLGGDRAPDRSPGAAGAHRGLQLLDAVVRRAGAGRRGVDDPRRAPGPAAQRLRRARRRRLPAGQPVEHQRQLHAG